MRPSMQLSAVSTPAAIWLWHWPVVMLSMKVRSLSRSAKARLSRKAPLAANFAGVVGVALGALATPFYTALALAVLGDLKVRKEGTDLEQRISATA